MADFYSTQLAGLIASPKVWAPATQVHGKMRVHRFDYTQAAAGAADDRIAFCVLPKGRIHVLLYSSPVAHSALGAARTLSIGWDAYLGVDSLGNPETIPADDAGLANAIDVSGAGILVGDSWNGANLSADKAYEFRSREGVNIWATIKGGTIPADAKFNGYLIYTCE